MATRLHACHAPVLQFSLSLDRLNSLYVCWAAHPWDGEEDQLPFVRQLVVPAGQGGGSLSRGCGCQGGRALCARRSCPCRPRHAVPQANCHVNRHQAGRAFGRHCQATAAPHMYNCLSSPAFQLLAGMVTVSTFCQGVTASRLAVLKAASEPEEVDSVSGC